MSEGECGDRMILGETRVRYNASVRFLPIRSAVDHALDTLGITFAEDIERIIEV